MLIFMRNGAAYFSFDVRDDGTHGRDHAIERGRPIVLVEL